MQGVVWSLRCTRVGLCLVVDVRDEKNDKKRETDCKEGRAGKGGPHREGSGHRQLTDDPLTHSSHNILIFANES